MDKVKASILNLSKREKILIYSLLIMVLICVGWLIFQPQFNTNRQLASEIEALQTSIDTNTIIIETGDINQNITTSTEQLNQMKEQFYNIMPTEDIDQLLTQLATTNRLTPVDLTIDEAVVETWQSDDSDDDEQVEDDEEEEETSSIDVYSCTIQQTVIGSQTNLIQLMDQVRENHSLHITNISYDFTNESNQSFVILYKVYMIQK